MLKSIALSCVAFSVSSIIMILSNKAAATCFNSPCVLLILQNLSTIIIGLFDSAVRNEFRVADTVSWLPCALLFTINIFTSMKAMEVLSVTSFTTIRNALPCVSAAVDYLVFKQILKVTEIVALVAITFGLAFFYRADVTYNYAGYLWTAVHMCSMTAYLCAVKISSERLKMGARCMSMYNNIGSLPLLVLIAACIGETHTFEVASLSRSCVYVVSISCVCGFFISWTAMQAQKHVSITSFTILNTVSKLPAIMLSKFFFDGATTSGMVYGSMFTFVGCTVYSLSKQGFLKQTTLRVNYAHGIYIILILWSVYLAYTLYVLVRPSIASDKTFRRLKSNFSNFSKSRMQALSDLHFDVSVNRSSDFVSGVSTLRNNVLTKDVVPGRQNTKALKYNRLLPTGFGDRMSVYLTVAAAAATVGADVYVYWHDNPDDQMVCEVCRLGYETIRPFVRWPVNMHVLREVDFEGKTQHMDTIEYGREGLLVSHHAFDGIYTTAWKTFGLSSTLPQLSRNSFELSYRKVAREMRIECPSREWEPVSMGKFVVLHFRCGDKMQPLSDFNTVEVLRRIPGHVYVVVVTDDDNQFNEMLSVSGPFVANITRLSPLPDKSVTMMRDFAVLLNATGIIQHSTNAWSSYSSVPAMMRGIPLLNTWIGGADLRSQNTSSVGLLRSFAENGGCPVELTSSRRDAQISAFMDIVA